MIILFYSKVSCNVGTCSVTILYNCSHLEICNLYNCSHLEICNLYNYSHLEICNCIFILKNPAMCFIFFCPTKKWTRYTAAVVAVCHKNIIQLLKKHGHTSSCCLFLFFVLWHYETSKKISSKKPLRFIILIVLLLSLFNNLFGR